jgi:hypothetical protein
MNYTEINDRIKLLTANWDLNDFIQCFLFGHYQNVAERLEWLTVEPDMLFWQVQTIKCNQHTSYYEMSRLLLATSENRWENLSLNTVEKYIKFLEVEKERKSKKDTI